MTLAALGAGKIGLLTSWSKASFDNIVVNTLPDPWEAQDIGAVGAAGSASHSNGTFSVAGAGAGIFGTADEFQFVHQQLTGDCTIIARVASIQDVDGVAWEHAGVMIRETLAANSAYAGVYQTPTNGVLFEQRSMAGGSAASAGSATGSLSWLKLARSGNIFTASRSSDGTNWTSVGTPQTITMTPTVYVGLAVSSEADAATCLATFDNVEVTDVGDSGAITDLNRPYPRLGCFPIGGPFDYHTSTFQAWAKKMDVVIIGPPPKHYGTSTPHSTRGSLEQAVAGIKTGSPKPILPRVMTYINGHECGVPGNWSNTLFMTSGIN